ncbi:cytoplasmic polyadenylation element-binding protein 3 [Platysternon megacephalum]|uniref:Cytoplasmic polyadenylation element-binding protein 3 n=1 Tax=Platysternon megacephalum TaxID=55544 RepID=A0A4D9EER3_9SAUR|nr:cytoplasmic polyadenylation element-binding protein 3 [Platysternon megacephalum]
MVVVTLSCRKLGWGNTQCFYHCLGRSCWLLEVTCWQVSKLRGCIWLDSYPSLASWEGRGSTSLSPGMMASGGQRLLDRSSQDRQAKGGLAAFSPLEAPQ